MEDTNTVLAIEVKEEPIGFEDAELQSESISLPLFEAVEEKITVSEALPYVEKELMNQQPGIWENEDSCSTSDVRVKVMRDTTSEFNMSKRQRGRNYNDYEKNILLNLISKYASIENKKTDLATVREKEYAWECLTREFNLDFAVTKRSVKQLKQLYINMKRGTKNEEAAEKSDRSKTLHHKTSDYCNGAILTIVDDRADCNSQGNAEGFISEDPLPSSSMSTTTTTTVNQVSSQEEERLEDEPAVKLSRLKNEKTCVNKRGSFNFPSNPRHRIAAATWRRANTRNLAKKSTSLHEMQKSLLLEKHDKECELLDIKIENARLKQEYLLKKIDSVV